MFHTFKFPLDEAQKHGKLSLEHRFSWPFQLDQADLGMPSPAYYLSVDNLDVYKRYAIKVAIMFGADSNAATAEMDDVVGLEIKLANVSHVIMLLCYFL